MKPIRVMVVDDSATVRKVLTQVLSAVPDIQVIATAPDPLFALDKMKRDWPDVLVLDIECRAWTPSPSCATSWPNGPRRW